MAIPERARPGGRGDPAQRAGIRLHPPVGPPSRRRRPPPRCPHRAQKPRHDRARRVAVAAAGNPHPPVRLPRGRRRHRRRDPAPGAQTRPPGFVPDPPPDDRGLTGFILPGDAGGPQAPPPPLPPGRPAPDGNAAIVSAGTGLGETILVRHQGDLVPVPSEGGHADFAPRTDPELEVFRALRAEYGRVSVERVLSGPGLVNVARVLHARDGAGDVMAGHMREAGPDALPAAISGHALAGTCASCARSLDLLVGVYGAEAGNAALRGLARSGVYLGGGIPPRILPA